MITNSDGAVSLCQEPWGMPCKHFFFNLEMEEEEDATGRRKFQATPYPRNIMVTFSLPSHRSVLRAQLRKRHLSASSQAASIPLGIT